MRVLIKNATIVNEGTKFRGSIVINNERIVEILQEDTPPSRRCKEEIDATGLYLIPGVIDDHVHFREPGLTSKATIHSESRAAAAGGVTSYMEMPNTQPQTTTIATLRDKFYRAKKESAVNYSFYFGATNDNCHLFQKLNPRRTCGIKLFMGSSTGNMLVDGNDSLEQIFSTANMPIAVHCEDSAIIAANTARVIAEAGENPNVKYHPVIRNAEACYQSTKKAVELAKKFGTQLHIMHISTREELELLSAGDCKEKNITAEVTPAHLLFCDKDYGILDTKIKCNPAIKSEADRDALRTALRDDRIDLIGTDHAPHLLEDKRGGALSAASGIPSIQFSLLTMLQLCNDGCMDITQLVQKMCHAPAEIFKISKRGFIRKGYFADFVLLDPKGRHRIKKKDIISKCGWSPFEGVTFDWKVRQTWVNGLCAYDNGTITEKAHAKLLEFDR